MIAPPRCGIPAQRHWREGAALLSRYTLSPHSGRVRRQQQSNAESPWRSLNSDTAYDRSPMSTFENLRIFIAVVREGSFSAAARKMGAVPSAVMKKINRLEDEVGSALFVRSTRALQLTDAGERLYPRAVSLISEVADTFADLRQSRASMTGSLRIKCPTTLGIRFLSPIFTDFQIAHPKCRIELVLVDRSLNPAEEGFDIALGAMPASYPSVAEFPFAPYPRSMVAAPAYMAGAPALNEPRDLTDHSCLVFQTTGTVWSFLGPTGPVSVAVNARFSTNDSLTLIDASMRGLGISIVSSFLSRTHIERGELIHVLPEWKVPELWVKALVPEAKRSNPLIQAFLDWMRDAVDPAPWA